MLCRTLAGKTKDAFIDKVAGMSCGEKSNESRVELCVGEDAFHGLSITDSLCSNPTCIPCSVDVPRVPGLHLYTRLMGGGPNWTTGCQQSLDGEREVISRVCDQFKDTKIGRFQTLMSG